MASAAETCIWQLFDSPGENTGFETFREVSASNTPRDLGTLEMLVTRGTSNPSSKYFTTCLYKP